jgi:hypothetical protein
VLSELARDGRPVRATAWERMPELEGLPEYQDAVVGCWQWTSAGMYYAAGVNVRPYRDESVTVYAGRPRGRGVPSCFPSMPDGAQVRNTLTLKRLSGPRDMWPEFRR